MLALLALIIDHVAELGLHGLNRQQVCSLFELSDVLQAVLAIVLRFINFVLRHFSGVEVVYCPSDFILNLSGVQGDPVSQVKRQDHVVEDIVYLDLPRLAVISWWFGGIGQEGKSAGLVLEISDLPDANGLAFGEEVDAGAEGTWADEIKFASSLGEIANVEDTPLSAAGQQVKQFVAIDGAACLVEYLGGDPVGVKKLIFLAVYEDLGFLGIELRGNHRHSVVLHENGVLKVAGLGIEINLNEVLEKHI